MPLVGLRACDGKAVGNRKDHSEGSVETGSSALVSHPKSRLASGTHWM